MKRSIIAAKINELINYAKHEYSRSKGLHLNSKDWESFIHVGNPQIYSFITNGTLIFYTVSKISGETYKQPVKLSEFKKIEAPLLLLYLIGANDIDIETFMIRFFSSTKSKIFCQCNMFQYWGPHYNLTQMGSAYGAGENRPPDIRDPKRKNIVCKHLWQVLKSYNGLIRTLVSELRPYYLRMFGIQSPKGIDRLKRQLGKKGFKKIIEQAINDISKTSDPLLVNIFNNLTKGKLNIVNAPAEKIDKIMKQSKDIPPILDTDKLQTIPELPEEIKPEEPIKEPEVTDEDVNEDLYSEMDLETPAKLKTEKEKEEQDKNKQQEQNEMYEKLKNKQVEFDPTALDSSKIIRAALRKY